jgi:hypothetical protein
MSTTEATPPQLRMAGNVRHLSAFAHCRGVGDQRRMVVAAGAYQGVLFAGGESNCCIGADSPEGTSRGLETNKI